MDIETIDTGNQQLVGLAGDQIVVMMPTPRMTREQALVHAAWLVVLAERDTGEFAAILERLIET